VGDGSAVKSDTAEGTIDQDEILENLREVENHKLLYAELASAYLLDPGARLEVTDAVTVTVTVTVAITITVTVTVAVTITVTVTIAVAATV
jgi:hypothetical protein